MGYFRQPLSEEIFKKKYCLHGETSPEDVFYKVAEEISSVEKTPELREQWKQNFYTTLKKGELIPAGRILANARPDSPMKHYNNCFTIDVEDSIEGIFESLKEDAIIGSVGGGVGFDISNLRPAGSPLSKGGESSGVISFLKVFDQSAQTIMTGGARRSAHIAILRIDHPEVVEFITCKQGEDNNVLTQFNISVAITDDFITAVEEDADWDLIFDGKVYKTIKARWLWDLVAKNAYEHNEPGIFNVDHVERHNNGSYAFRMDRCNPCAELPMPPYSLCCLSAINLTKFVMHPFSHQAFFDFKSFGETVGVGVRFLDNVLDATSYPLEKIEELSKRWRRIGLGFTGLGNTFTMLGMSYGSPDSKVFSERVASQLMVDSYNASIDLAIEKGSFPDCNISKLLNSGIIKETLPEHVRKRIDKHGLRNIGLNTIAPTGTTSLSLGQNCSSGIEPTFSLAYDRNVRTGRGDETIKERIYDYAYILYKEEFGEDAKIPSYFSTTLDIDVEAGLEIQAIFQKYIDHSISKTHNLKPGTTFEEYKDLFMKAYKAGVKGFTTFNPEGSMKGVLEHSSSKKEEKRIAPKRPYALGCEIHHISSKGEKFMVLVGLLDGTAYEVFVAHPIDGFKDRTGGIVKAKKGHYKLLNNGGEVVIENLGKGAEKQYGFFTRILSSILRHQNTAMPLQFTVDAIAKDDDFTSFSRGMARVLKKYIPEEEEVLTSAKCPECGEVLTYIDGCKTCMACRWSKCD